MRLATLAGGTALMSTHISRLRVGASERAEGTQQPSSCPPPAAARVGARLPWLRPPLLCEPWPVPVLHVRAAKLSQHCCWRDAAWMPR